MGIQKRVLWRRVLPAIAVAAMAVQPAYAAPAPLELTPISAWHVDWSKESCVVRSVYGTKENPVLLQLERFAPYDGFAVVVTGRPFAKFSGKVNIVYGPGGAVDEQDHVMPGTSAAGTPALFFQGSAVVGDRDPENLQPITPEQEKAVTSIAFSKRGKQTVLLKTGRLDRVLAELRKCTDDLVRTWQLDPEQQRRRTRLPVATSYVGNWIQPSDYPRNVLGQGKQSIINFVLLVDAKGKTTGCRVQRSYGDEAFVRRTCEALTRRAGFQPALDAEGKPIASYYVNTVRWIVGTIP